MSGMKPELTNRLFRIAESDVSALVEAHRSYGESWKKRGGVGAYMMLARKWDRIENQMQQCEPQFDILNELCLDMASGKKDGILDDVRDLRRYLELCEAEAQRMAEVVREELDDDEQVAHGGPTRAYVAQ